MSVTERKKKKSGVKRKQSANKKAKKIKLKILYMSVRGKVQRK